MTSEVIVRQILSGLSVECTSEIRCSSCFCRLREGARVVDLALEHLGFLAVLFGLAFEFGVELVSSVGTCVAVSIWVSRHW